MDYNDLARNSEDTLTSPICSFITFNIGCVPQALKEAVFVLCWYLLCQKPREEIKSNLSRNKSPEATFVLSIILTPISSIQPVFPGHCHTLLHQGQLVDEKELEINFSPEHDILWLEFIFPCSSEKTKVHLLTIPSADVLLVPPGFPPSVILHFPTLQDSTQFRPLLCLGGTAMCSDFCSITS